MSPHHLFPETLSKITYLNMTCHKNQSFDLMVRCQGHSDFIIYIQHSDVLIHIHTKYES